MLQQKSVLVVEDSDMTRQIICLMLKKMGCSCVTESCNVRAALEKINERKFDVVFSDIEMPEMDGFELLEKVRGQANSIPIVFLTSHEDEDVRDRAFELGVSEFLTKPPSTTKLSGAIERVFFSNTVH